VVERDDRLFLIDSFVTMSDSESTRLAIAGPHQLGDLTLNVNPATPKQAGNSNSNSNSGSGVGSAMGAASGMGGANNMMMGGMGMMNPAAMMMNPMMMGASLVFTLSSHVYTAHLLCSPQSLFFR
jgi:hypothetical protein